MVAVNIVEQFKVDINAPASPVTVCTTTAAPNANDLILVIAAAFADNAVGAFSMSGLGASWSRYATVDTPGTTQPHSAASVTSFVARGATAAGTITMTHNAFRGTVWVFHLRAADASVLSAIYDGQRFAGTASTTAARALHSGDKVFAVSGVTAASGTPTLTPSAAFDAAQTGQDGVFVEATLGYRSAAGDESFTAAFAAGATRTGMVATVHVTTDPRADRRVFGHQARTSVSTTATVMPVNESPFLTNDLVVVTMSYSQSATPMSVTVTGLGATWTIDRGGESATSGQVSTLVAFGRGATTRGDVTVTPSGQNLNGNVGLVVVRGLTTTVVEKTNVISSSTTLSQIGTALTADNNEVVMLVGTGNGSNDVLAAPNPGDPTTGWKTLNSWGGVYAISRIAYRPTIADGVSHNATVTSTFSRLIRVDLYRLGVVVAPQSAALSRASETDSAGRMRSGPPGTTYEEAPFPGLNRDADHRYWFSESSGIPEGSYGATSAGVLEWTWPYAYTTGYQLETRRIGAIDTSVENYAFVEWYVDAQSGVTPDCRMKSVSGSPEYDVLQEDLGGGWYRSWFDWTGQSGSNAMDGASGPYVEWSGIASGGKVKVRKFGTSATLQDDFTQFKIQRVQTVEYGTTLTPAVSQTAPLSRATETETARTIAAPTIGPLGRATETDTATPFVLPQFVALDRATEADAARSVLPGFVVPIGRATEADEARTLTPLEIEAPPYDLLAEALLIAGDYGVETMTLQATTVSVGETVPFGVEGTAWAAWVAEETTTVTFTVDADDDATIWLTAYTGDPASLVVQDSGAGTVTIEFEVVEGQTYWLQVGGLGGAAGPRFDLRWAIAPVIVPPAEPYEYARVEVYDPTGDTLLSEIPKRSGLTWQEPVNEPGAGEMTVRLDDPLLKSYADAGTDLLDWGNIVKVWLGETCVHGFRIKRRRLTLVDAGEHKVAWARTVSGPSVQHMLDDFIVRHWPTTRDRSLESRSFMWHAPESAWFDEDDWQTDYNAWDQTDPPGDFDEAPEDRAKWKNPPKFPDADAQWLWVSPDPDRNDDAFDPPGPMNGMRYWRKVFSTAEKNVVRMFASADESYRVYLDGEEVLAGDGEETGYTEMQRRKVLLHPGEHTIAIWTQSGGDEEDSDGADAVLFTMMKLNRKGKPIETVVRTDDSWLTTYVRPVPSWNRAQVMRKVIFEAQDRGVEAALALSLGFTGATDTAGKPWLDRFNRDVEVGTTGLALQAMLSEDRGFDVWVDPENLMVRAWRRRGTDKSHSVTLEAGRNLLAWEIEESDEAKTSYLIHYDGGWADWVAPSASKRLGIRETFVTLGKHTDDDEAVRVIKKAARGIAWAEKKAGTGDIRKRPENAPAGALVAVDGARPFLDFGPGDIVKGPNEWGVLVPHRVMMLTGTEDDDGALSYDPVLEEV